MSAFQFKNSFIILFSYIKKLIIMTKTNFFFSVACATLLFISAGNVSAEAPNLYEGFDYLSGETTLNADAAN